MRSTTSGRMSRYAPCNGIQIVLLALVLCTVTVETAVAVDSSTWEWRLSEWTMGTVLMRPTPTDPWGTVCSTGMKSSTVAAFICRKVGIVPPATGSLTAVWDVVPGPSSYPRYLDEARCPSGMTDLHNCSWGAGDPLVLGAGYRPSGCTHQEDMYISVCQVVRIPTTIQYRLEPLSGLGLTARTGTLQAKIAPGMPWGRVVLGGGLSGFHKGVPQMLCEAMYPDITTSQLYNRAALLPQSMCTESTTAAANTFTAFKWQSFNLRVDVLGFSSTYTEAPMCLTCEAIHEARLVDGGALNQGNAQIRWEVPNVYVGAWTSVCKPISTGAQMMLAEIICDAQCAVGSHCAGAVMTGTPYGTAATPGFVYATSATSLEEAVNWPASKPRQLAKLGLMDPPMYERVVGSCSDVLPIKCTVITTPPSLSCASGSRELSGALYAFSSVMNSNLPLVYVKPTFWEGVAVCNTLGWTGSTPVWTPVSDLLPYISEKYGAALVCDYDLPSINSGTSSCKVEPRISDPTKSAHISCATKPIGSRYPNTETIGYENPDLYEFRLAQPTNVMDYVEGIVEMRGNASRAWQPFCVDFASTATELEIISSILCQSMYTDSVYGTVSSTTYTPPAAIGPGETALSAVGMGFCKMSASDKITGKDTVVTNKICPLEKMGMLCKSRFGVRCYKNYQYGFYDAAPDGKSGILQAKLGGTWRAVRLGSTKAAELICAEMNLPSEYAFYDFFATTNPSVGDYHIYFEDCPATAQVSSDCPHLPFGSSTGAGYVRLYCQQPVHPPTGFEFQIADGTPNNGNLNMRLTSSMPWSPVCAESLTFTSDAATLACVSLFGSRVTLASALIGTGLDNTNQIRHLFCDDYTNVSSCRAGHILESLPGPTCTQINVDCSLMNAWNVRLVDGTASSNGKVQVQDADDVSNWLTMCNDNFKVDRRLWSAVCAQIGHPHRRPTYRLDSTISTSGGIAGVGMYGHDRCTDALTAGGFANISLQCFTKFQINCKHAEDSFLDCAPPLTATLTLEVGPARTLTDSQTMSPTLATSTPTSPLSITITSPQTHTIFGNTVTPTQTAASTLTKPESQTESLLSTSTGTKSQSHPMTTSDPITLSMSGTISKSRPTATRSPPMTTTFTCSGTHTILLSTTLSLSVNTMSASILQTATPTETKTAPDSETATLTSSTSTSMSISNSAITDSSSVSHTITDSDTTSYSTTTTPSTSLSSTISNSLTTSLTTTGTMSTSPSDETPSESTTETLSQTISKGTVSYSSSPTTTDTETDEVTTSSTIQVNCVNYTWPPVRRGCLLTKPGCTTSKRTIQFDDWSKGKEVLYEVSLLFPLGIRREALLHSNESIKVTRGNHPPPSASSPHQDVNDPQLKIEQGGVNGGVGELYSRLSPPFIISEVLDNAEARIRTRVYVDTHTRSRLLVRVGRQLGSSEPTSAATTQIGALLATHPWSGIFNCSLPSDIDRMSGYYQASEVEVTEEEGIAMMAGGGIEGTTNREIWQPPPAAILRQWGIYLPLGGDLLFDSPPPALDEGTRKAAQATATVGAVASVVAGPIAADMQALGALGAIACAPGGGSAAGQNQEASEDSIQSLSPVALTPTCTGLMLGNIAFLGACLVLQSLGVGGVFFFKRVIKHERRYPFISALGLLRMPSLLFTAMAALQMGFLVCGYNLLQRGSGGAGASSDSAKQQQASSSSKQQEVGLGVAGLLFAVLLPILAVLTTATLITRRRFNIQFQSFALSAPSRNGTAPKTADDLLSSEKDDDGAVEVLNLQEEENGLENDEEMAPLPPRRRSGSNTSIDPSSLSTSSTPPPPKPQHHPSKLRRLVVALFLPSSSIDNEYHPLTNAFSTLIGRTRLKRSVWSSLPYLTPLAMFPAVFSPVHMCELMMWIAAALHILLGVVHLVFRPQAILFANITNGVAILLNGMLVGSSAVLAGSPTESGPRSVIATLSLLQIVISVIRLLHVAVVSLAIPLLMALKMLAPPVRLAPSTSVLPITSSTMFNNNSEGDVDEEIDLEMMEPGGDSLNTSIVLDLRTESTIIVTNKEARKSKLRREHRRRSSSSGVPAQKEAHLDGKSEIEVQPMWTVRPSLAPQWPPASWSTDKREHDDDSGVAGDLLGALLDATGAIGPQATKSAPASQQQPPPPVSTKSLPIQQHYQHHSLSSISVSLSPTPNASFVTSAPAEEEEEDVEDDDDLDLLNTDTAYRIKMLQDPNKNPMAMMHSTAMTINGLKSRSHTLVKGNKPQKQTDADLARSRGESVMFALYPFTGKDDNENSIDDCESTATAPELSNNDEINSEDI